MYIFTSGLNSIMGKNGDKGMGSREGGKGEGYGDTR